jgi:hypothetical protein
MTASALQCPPAGVRCAAVLLAAVCATSVAQAAPLHRYSVEVSDALDTLRVRACFDGDAPAALVAETSGARTFLETMNIEGRALAPESGQQVMLAGAPANACVDYRVKLRPAQSAAQTGGPETRRVGRDMLTSIGDWLWRPPDLAEGAGIELVFRLPAGVAVSTPWPRVASSDGRPAFRIGSGPALWPGIVAFGGFEIRQIEVPGATLNLALLDGPPPEHEARIERWIARAARHVTHAHGRFPVPSLQVVVAPTTHGSGPVPWAYVARGGGPAVHLFINPSHQPAAFDRDWTATHEMSHLFLPYVSPPDAWLFEGLPTYMQNVLMVRGGAISIEEGWQRMIVGFQRGERSGSGLSLAQATERVAVGGNYLRVYWAGAAMMLEADLRLREQSGGRQSLDSALAGLAECCLSGERRWSAEEVVAKLDELSGSTVFSDVMREQFASADFPDFKRVLVRAGVTVKDGRVRLDPAAPGAAAREALMLPRD